MHTTRCDSNNGANYSPPRSLRDIFSSESKTREFEYFLAEIDEENDDEVMVTRLKFILKCRNLGNDVRLRDDGSTPEMRLSNTDKENGQTQGEEIEVMILRVVIYDKHPTHLIINS